MFLVRSDLVIKRFSVHNDQWALIQKLSPRIYRVGQE